MLIHGLRTRFWRQPKYAMKESRSMTRFLLSASAVVLLTALADRASAQYVPPGGPTLPTELQYFRPTQGVLDNYNQFVAPQYQLQNQLRTLDREQRTSFRALERQIQNSDKLRPTQASATGTSAGFMNYSHYYGMRGGVGGGRRR
jgi:hypothetical protein